MSFFHRAVRRLDSLASADDAVGPGGRFSTGEAGRPSTLPERIMFRAQPPVTSMILSRNVHVAVLSAAWFVTFLSGRTRGCHLVDQAEGP